MKAQNSTGILKLHHLGKMSYLSRLNKSKELLIIIFPVILYFLLFHYLPMAGVLISFQDFTVFTGIGDFFQGPWVGFKWFIKFFNSIYCSRLIRNTILLNVYGLLWGFPVPIIFALLLNEIKNGVFKRVIQTLSYLPYFISTVIIVGMISNFLSPNYGVINYFIGQFGGEPVNFMLNPAWFRTIYISSGIWAGFGFSSIIYLAALSGVDPSLYEAAEIDGASRLRKIFHISLPSILPTIMIILILSFGGLMSVGFEKIILMYNPATYETADVIATYVYREGIINANFGFSSAIGLFNSVINFILLVVFNQISKRVSEISLW